MTILPLDPADTREPGELRSFLEKCRARAAAERHAQLVSISVEVEALDPLAVLESIFEPTERHFFVERPAEGVALAGAEAVLDFAASGPERFAACQAFIDDALAHAVAVGAVESAFGGPHFFVAFTFEAAAGEPGEPPFPAASVFVPRWQVATRQGRTVAVANLLIEPQTPVGAVAERVWRAHAKFRAFDYGQPAAERTAAGGARLAVVAETGKAEHYRQAVAAAVAEIGAGRYQKVVLARTREVAIEGGGASSFHPLRVLSALRERFTDCYAFSVANGRGQSFIGASPERLLEVRHGRLRTEALAGSVRRGAGASEDAAMAAGLLRDEKELHEHRLVLDSIVGELRKLGLAPDFAERPGLRRFANVQHLHTPVEAGLGGARLLEIAARLHPTPAVGGWPREAALARIRALEGFPRGLYAGALGWIDCRGDGELLVGLRAALVGADRARLYAGAGIVAGSDPERELAETELKFRAVQEALLCGNS